MCISLSFHRAGRNFVSMRAQLPTSVTGTAGRKVHVGFLTTFRACLVPWHEALGQATPIGPCATMGGEDTWTEFPFVDGMVLIGDAGGYNGPIIGQGLSLALRDVRLLSE